MQFLAYIGNIDNSISFYLINSISNCSKISCSVAKASIWFLNHNRWWILFSNENAHSPITFNSYPLVLKFLYHRLKKWIIKAFSLFFQFYIKSIIYNLKFFSWKLTKHFPAWKTTSISTLQFDNIIMSFFLKFFVFIESFLCILIKYLQIWNIWSVC